MKNAAIGLLSSKKAVVYLVTVIVMAAVIFGGVDPAHAADFVEKLTMLSMAYLGGQGLADMGRYAGEAYASGKRAITESDRSGPLADRLEAGVDSGLAAGEATKAAIADRSELESK